MAVEEEAEGADEGERVEVAVHARPHRLVVLRAEGVQLIVEEQQLLAVAARRACYPLLLAVVPADPLCAMNDLLRDPTMPWRSSSRRLTLRAISTGNLMVQ